MEFALLIELDFLIKVMMQVILLVESITDTSNQFISGVILIRF